MIFVHLWLWSLPGVRGSRAFPRVHFTYCVRVYACLRRIGLTDKVNSLRRPRCRQGEAYRQDELPHSLLGSTGSDDNMGKEARMKYYRCIIMIRTRNHEQVTLGVNPSRYNMRSVIGRKGKKEYCPTPDGRTDQASCSTRSHTTLLDTWARSASDHRPALHRRRARLMTLPGHAYDRLGKQKERASERMRMCACKCDTDIRNMKRSISCVSELDV